MSDTKEELLDRIDKLKIKINKFTNSILQLIGNLIYSHELLIYKYINSKELENYELSDLKNVNIIEKLITYISTIYFENLYKKLKNSDSDDTINLLHDIKFYFNHTLVCIFNIFSELYLIIHKSLDRNNLKYDSEDDYEKSIKKEIDNILNLWFYEKTISFVFDKCDGEHCKT
jgi:hypothetical protein